MKGLEKLVWLVDEFSREIFDVEDDVYYCKPDQTKNLKAFFNHMRHICNDQEKKHIPIPIPNKWTKVSKIPQELRETYFVGYHQYLQQNKMVFLPQQQKSIVVGDIHADLQSLHELLKQEFFNIEKKVDRPILVFIGDYMGRGKEEVKTVITLLKLKENYPDKIVLLQGNHESNVKTSPVFGFYHQTLAGSRKHKHVQPQLFLELQESFADLCHSFPLEAMLFHEMADGNIAAYLCVHGFVNPTITINRISDLLDSRIDFPVRHWTNPITWACIHAQVHYSPTGMPTIAENGRWPITKTSVQALRALGLYGVLRGHNHTLREDFSSFVRTVVSTGGTSETAFENYRKSCSCPSILAIEENGSVIYKPIEKVCAPENLLIYNSLIKRAHAYRQQKSSAETDEGGVEELREGPKGP